MRAVAEPVDAIRSDAFGSARDGSDGFRDVAGFDATYAEVGRFHPKPAL